MIDEASIGTKGEAPTDDELVPISIQNFVGKGISEASKEGNENIETSENTPLRYVQKNHQKSQIIGEKDVGVQIVRNFVGISSYLALLSTIES